MFKLTEKNDYMVCPVCKGIGHRIDQKTGKFRPCVACKSRGKICVAAKQK